jgi:hypothetical protein
MRRREFISLLGGAVATWPLRVRAEQLGLPVIGSLCGGSSAGYGSSLTGFRDGLNESGFGEAHGRTHYELLEQRGGWPHETKSRLVASASRMGVRRRWLRNGSPNLSE